MGTVAEGLVFGTAAAAQADRGASAQAERISLGILNHEIAFHAKRAVAVDRNFS